MKLNIETDRAASNPSWKGEHFMANILIASLGESPIVVTAMYKLLIEQEGYELDKVVVLRPEGDDVKLGYDLVEDALKDKCALELYRLPFKDADDESTSYTFLQMLVGLLAEHQKNDDYVYLSLAGGRKS